MEYEESVVEVPGARLLVRTAGSPEAYPLVLLHGWPDTGDGWYRVAPSLAQHFRLIVPDNRGFGRSSMPAGTDAYRMRAHLGDLRGLLEWAGANHAGVVGHDFGGAVAWQAGTFLAGLVDRIVVLSAPHPLNWKAKVRGNVDQLQRSFYVWLLNLGEPGERLLASANFEHLLDFAYGSVLDRERRDRLRANWSEPGRFHAMGEWYRAGYRPDLLDADIQLDLPQVTVPACYVHGMSDGAFIPELADGNGAFVAGPYEEHLIADGAHWLMLTHPERIAGIITDWMGVAREGATDVTPT